MVSVMGSYQDNVLTAWKDVNEVAASLQLTGAAPAFRKAIAQTDFESLVPSWDFGSFSVYVLDWLEGHMVYVDNAQQMAVVGRSLWTILSQDYDVLDTFVEDLVRGANGVKVIDYDAGPYRAAGAAWRERNEGLTPAPDPVTALQSELEKLLARASAISESSERSSEQFQTLFTEVASVQEKMDGMQAQLKKMQSMLELVVETVAEL